MSLVIRMARAGTKKRPFYHIVVADSRSPRDGRFIERIGYFNPLLPKDKTERLKFDLEKAKAWIAKGAQPSDRIMRFLDAAGVMKRTKRNNPQKAIPRKERKAQEEAAKAAAGGAAAAGAAAGGAAPAASAAPPAGASVSGKSARPMACAAKSGCIRLLPNRPRLRPTVRSKPRTVASSTSRRCAQPRTVLSPDSPASLTAMP